MDKGFEAEELTQGCDAHLLLGRGIAWLDTGTQESMLQAGTFVETVQQRQGLMIACPDEIAFRMGLIDAEQVLRLAEPLKKNHHGQYLIHLIRNG